MIYHVWAERVNADVILYTDHSTLAYVSPTLVNLREKAQVELSTVTKWMRVHKVVQNYL